MQTSFPMPLAEMVHFRLDTSKLQSNLDFLWNLAMSSKTDFESTKSLFQSELIQFDSEISELKKLEPKIAICQAKIIEFQSLKGKIDSWDDRFRSLEEKIFNIQHETNANLKELSNTIETKVASTKTEFETTLNIVQRNLDEKYSKEFEEFDNTNFENFTRLENIINNELAKRCTAKMVKKLIKTELLKNLSKNTELEQNQIENEFDEKKNKEKIDEKEEDNEEDLENYNISEIYLRLGNLEKKLNLDFDYKHKTDFPQRHGRFLENTSESSKAENLSDFQLKFIRIVNEINDLRELVNSFSSQITNSHNGMPMSTVDLNALEDLENKISHMESLHAKNFEDLNHQIYYLKNEISSSGSPTSKRRQKPAYTLSAKSVHSLSNLEQNVSAQVESISEKLNSDIESIKKEISTIQNNLTLKVFRAELEEILTKLNKQNRTNLKEETQNRDGTPGHDLKSLEGRVNSMWMSLEKIHKMEEAFQKVVNENIETKIHKFDDKLDNQYKELLEKMQEMQRFFVVEVGDKGDQIDYFAEKMQNVEEEIKDMKEHQKPIVKYQVIENKNEGEGCPDENLLELSEDMFDIKTLIKQLRLQDSHIKQANSSIKNLSSDVEKIKEIINKDQEDGLNAYLNQLEDLQKNVSEVMIKVQEGSRLSQRDFSMLTELYQIIEGKGNKDEILEKVDRKELKQAYRNLSKKIDTVQDELKKIEELKNKTEVKIEKPAFFKQKGNECLACGQDIPTPAYTTREWTYSGSFPALTHSRFGPGFSRILPMVHTSNEATNKSHKKSKSELPLPLMRTVETAEPDPKLISVTLSRKASVKSTRIKTTMFKERF
ncbi:unnamed protein product [Blepharisma stoltei]|uniref:Uncharacterized protein n=1 Tax=Blepharisma stoltei TaxID=1481888 RepID=A0AAU9JI40_9CILI|nr:unnamed protein product [Blepharisma stoltei]